jgi:hypothetical protein
MLPPGAVAAGRATPLPGKRPGRGCGSSARRLAGRGRVARRLLVIVHDANSAKKPSPDVTPELGGGKDAGLGGGYAARHVHLGASRAPPRAGR